MRAQEMLDDAENARLLREAGDAYTEEDYKVVFLLSSYASKLGDIRLGVGVP